MLFVVVNSFSALGKVGINTNEPKAVLDIISEEDGILIPRVRLSTIIGPTSVSELVYNTESSIDYSPGFYYWDGFKWIRLIDNNQQLSVSGDQLTISEGNTVTIPILDEDVEIPTVPLLSSGWNHIHPTAPFSYHEDRGIVYFSGGINGYNATDGSFCTLPEDKRPNVNKLVITYSDIGIIRILIHIDGNVSTDNYPIGNFPGYVSFDGVSFRKQ